MGTVIVNELEIVADGAPDEGPVTSVAAPAAAPADVGPAPLRPTDVEAIERFYAERAQRVFAH